MLRNLSSIACVLVLGACTTPEVRIEYKEVKVPIAVPCAVDIPAPPTLYFAEVKEDADIFVKVRALLADRKVYEAHIGELTGALELCRK